MKQFHIQSWNLVIFHRHIYGLFFFLAEINLLVQLGSQNLVTYNHTNIILQIFPTKDQNMLCLSVQVFSDVAKETDRNALKLQPFPSETRFNKKRWERSKELTELVTGWDIHAKSSAADLRCVFKWQSRALPTHTDPRLSTAWGTHHGKEEKKIHGVATFDW